VLLASPRAPGALGRNAALQQWQSVSTVSSQGTTEPVQSMRRDPSCPSSGDFFIVVFCGVSTSRAELEVLSNSELAQVVPFGGRRRKRHRQR